MIRRLVSALVVFACLGMGGAVAAQAAGEGLAPGSRVSLLTVTPGEQVHALFGHTAIRVRNAALGNDVVFNYGTFEFGPDFIPRFVYGELDYYLSLASYEDAMAMWRWEQRGVSEQALALSQQQAEAVLRFLLHNAQPEQRVYRYDFLLDNCSTRVGDAFVSALGAELELPGADSGPRSFREMLDPYVAGAPFLHLGIDLLMGLPVDREATPQEQLFLPDDLALAFDHATLIDGDGVARPLVSGTRELVGRAAPHLPTPAPRWDVIAAWALLAVGIPLGRRRAWSGLLLLLLGLAGCFIALLWAVTLHHVTDQNLNLLWAWPTHVVAGVAVLRGRGSRGLERYLFAAGVVSLLVALVMPFLPQRLPGAALPLALATAFACWRQLRPGVGTVARGAAAASPTDPEEST
ncbi:MAG: hypothetical protein DRQ55_09875 [Planctomycetota bacterium]|nr:MAG: hypothetical protein DRQ55_09875 [Planctomycetota bacterium]